MAGIIYRRERGAIVLHLFSKGEEHNFYTPQWLIQQVIDGKRSFGHFNPEADLDKYRKLKRANNGKKADFDDE